MSVHGTVSRIAVNRIATNPFNVFGQRLEQNPLAGVLGHASSLRSGFARRLAPSLLPNHVLPAETGRGRGERGCQPRLCRQDFNRSAAQRIRRTCGTTENCLLARS